MAVYQFQNNDYEAPYYEYEREEAKADFKAAYLADELKRRNLFVLENFENKSDSIKDLVASNLEVIRNTLRHEPVKPGFEKVDLDKELTPETYSKLRGLAIDNAIEQYRKHYQKVYNDNVALKEKKMAFYEKNGFNITEEKDRYFNESLSDLVKNVNTKSRLLEYDGKLIQQINPVFQEPTPAHLLDYRTSFFFPEKNLLGATVSTYWFNMLVIWSMTLILYLLLYFEVLKKVIDSFGKVSIPKRK
jgi:hypothetical protein